MKRLVSWGLLGALLVILTSACTASPSTQAVKLASASSLPPAMQNAPANVREAYQFALANQDVLKFIPCYCGCGAEGHTSVKDCFVQEVRADGTVIWDEMGLG